MKDLKIYLKHMESISILFYTSSRESPEFAQKIQDNIIKNCGDIPIISVSQKPMDFGKNICVGEVGHSYLNEFRQILIGAKEAKTQYLIFAEADFLYPKEYFEFKPTTENIYRYDNVWLVFKHRGYNYYRKPYSIGAQICKREFIIQELEKYLEGLPEWFDGKFVINKQDYNGAPFTYFSGQTPCISFKTGNGMTSSASTVSKRKILPFYGDAEKIYKLYLE
jgi:hypothetical protein